MAQNNEETTFEDFVELINALADSDGQKERSSMISRFVRDGPNESLHPETTLILKCLIPKSSQRTFNLQDKQLVKIFSEIFNEDRDEMIEDLEKGDVAATLCKFFKKSESIRPLKTGKVTLKQVDKWLEDLSHASGDEAKSEILKKCAKQCTLDEFLVFIRLIKKDLRTNTGPKQVLDALGGQAYAAFQTSHDLDAVVQKVRGMSVSGVGGGGVGGGLKRNVSVSVRLMTPVKPMLAEPGRSAVAVIAKSVGGGGEGALAEIKYDGERLQVHKQGDRFAYFSRSLKPVTPHKVEHLKEFIPKAFPGANDLIIDSEVLLLDTKTQKPLPFGTLGAHKKTQFKDACVCLFVFDCLYFNGKSLLMEPMKRRREILEEVMTEVPNRVLLSEKHEIKTVDELNDLMARVFAEGLEGLVIKPKSSVYEPGKRHWIKIKKDYLGEGAMADSADLIVLGAYYGTGKKGGMKSVYLMGAYDAAQDVFCTVTKVGNGFDDATLRKLDRSLRMVKISKDYSKVPPWLKVHRSLVPDFVVCDPKKSPVWEITGAEFSRAGTHTAGAGAAGAVGGISVRFPRVTRQRPDKTWREATDVARLEALLGASHSPSEWAHRLAAVSGSAVPSADLRRSALKRTQAVDHANTDDVIFKGDLVKKPRLTRVRDTLDFRYLRSVLTGFVIAAPKPLVSDASFDHLHRRLVACGAEVIGEGLRPSTKQPTHVIDWPCADQSSVQLENVKHLTVEWLEKTMDENKLQPLPM